MDTDDINKAKVAVVTGSSSGIGFETSLLLAKNGVFTYATMRNLDRANKIIELKQKEKLPLEVLKLDVTDDKSVNDAIGKIENEQETIDILVNNAGYALVGPLEELSIQEFKEQFENQCIWCYQGYPISVTNYEKATEWHNSKCELYSW